eukprot:TRINITY_DN21237_c0_g1_i1.p1 TRINITY_DN21237_c0_g1~~TRINITY_DN21237_c0_g1_i1.p1  ORF type:complete len:229 (-),score=10.56 TRINITY_DN21237_c0_g1_i1:112-798(-)
MELLGAKRCVRVQTAKTGEILPIEFVQDFDEYMSTIWPRLRAKCQFSDGITLDGIETVDENEIVAGGNVVILLNKLYKKYIHLRNDAGGLTHTWEQKGPCQPILYLLTASMDLAAAEFLKNNCKKYKLYWVDKTGKAIPEDPPQAGWTEITWTFTEVEIPSSKVTLPKQHDTKLMLSQNSVHHTIEDVQQRLREIMQSAKGKTWSFHEKGETIYKTLSIDEPGEFEFL